MKNFQLFIVRHYDAIKLVMLAVNLALVGYLILTAIAEGQQDSERRSRAITQAVEQINEKTDEQTDQLNRQLQALCYIIVITAGEEALRQIDPPLEEQCRDLSAELKERPDNEESTYTPIRVSDQPQVRTEPAPTTAPAQQPTAPEAETPLVDTPTIEPRKPMVERVIDRVNDLLGGLL